MRRTFVILVLILSVTVAATCAQAFDNDRKGFMLNLGAGFGQGKMKVSSNSTSVSFDGSGIGTDFKIGAGLSPKTEIYYSNRALWYSVDMPDPFGGGTFSADAINGMSAVGLTYFLEPQAPSLFFNGAIGVGVLMDRDANDSESGAGITVGLGYEFTPHWAIEGTFMSAKVAEEAGADLSISSLLVTISWFAY